MDNRPAGALTLQRLQNAIRRDPRSNVDEFRQQHMHFNAKLQILRMEPDSYDEDFISSASFMCHVAPCFVDEMDGFPPQLVEFLLEYGPQLNSAVRMHLCKGLMVMYNRGFVSAELLVPLFLRLVGLVADKSLREYASIALVGIVRRIHQRGVKDQRIQSRVQNFFIETLGRGAESASTPTAARIAIRTVVELYRRRIWNDAKTVNIIADACFHRDTKTVVTALTFLVGRGVGDETEADGSDSDSDAEKDVHQLKAAFAAGKKSKKRKKHLERAIEMAKHKQKKKRRPERFDSGALHLIRDPQSFAERLFARLERNSSSFNFDVRLLLLDLLSRLIGVHKLLLLGFYPYVQRFAQPHQREVTRILLFVAQSTHDEVPPDALQPLVRAIADNFVSERNSGEVMTVGLNTIREIAARAPCALTENTDLLRDLAAYKMYKNKNVRMGARALIQLFRDIDPKLLHRKDRGRPTEQSTELQTRAYGETDTPTFVPGTEELELESDGEIDAEMPEGCAAVAPPDAKGSADSKESRKSRATVVSSTRLLTQKDHQRLRRRQIAKAVRKPIATKKGKPLAGDDEEDDSSSDSNSGESDSSEDEADSTTAADEHESVQLSDIVRLAKKPRTARDERLGDGERPLRGVRKRHSDKRQNPNASTTNKEKRKNKAYAMLRPKLMAKRKRSFRDKQLALRQSLLKQSRDARKHKH